MLHIALWEPEIPPNTGNIARSCAATGTRLHLIGRLGFRLDDKSLRRAGIDYWPYVDCVRHTSWAEFRAAVPGRIWLIENPAPRCYTEPVFSDEDVFVFGSESKGLPAEILAEFDESQRLMIPMPTGHVRSLNLATAAGIVLYEALRQIGYQT